MPPPESRESVRTRSSSRNGSSSAGGRSEHVSRNVSLDRVSLFQDFDRSTDPSHCKPVRSESEYDSDSNGSRSGNDIHGRTRSRGRSRGSNSGYETDGSMRSSNVTGLTRSRKLHSGNPRLGGSSDRDQSREPRSSSRDSTGSKRDKSASRVLKQPEPLQNNYYLDYGNLPPEFTSLSAYDGEEYPSDHRRKPGSKTRKKASKRDRSTEAPETIRPPLAPFDGEKHLKDQLANPQAEAKQPTIIERKLFPISDHKTDIQASNIHTGSDHYPKGHVAQFDSDPEEGSKIKRKPIKEREQPRGPEIKRNAEPQPKYHGNGDNQLNSKVSFSSTHKSPGVESKIDGAWHSFGGKDKPRTQIPPANTHRGSANERSPDYGEEILQDWWKGQSNTARTTERAGVEPKLKSRYRANDNPSSARDQGRKHHKNPEQYTPKKDIFAEYDAPPEKKKKKRSLKAVFGSWRK